VFFHQTVRVLPVLLLTLGIEFNYFRRTLTDAGQRAATAATVTVMAASLVGALSTLPWDGQGCGDVLSSWHEYVAFLFAVQGISRVGDSGVAAGFQYTRPPPEPVRRPNRVRAPRGLVDNWSRGLPDAAGVHAMQASKWLGHSTYTGARRVQRLHRAGWRCAQHCPNCQPLGATWGFEPPWGGS
jgi:hypothetical protein